MGWTYIDLDRNRMTLEQAKSDHVRSAADYNPPIRGGIVMHEWRGSTWYAIIALNFLEGHQKAGHIEHFLRVDMIDASPVSFGYKDMTETMGPYVDDRPSAHFARTVLKYIPHAEGYAADFRQRVGIPYLSAKPLLSL